MLTQMDRLLLTVLAKSKCEVRISLCGAVMLSTPGGDIRTRYNAVYCCRKQAGKEDKLHCHFDYIPDLSGKHPQSSRTYY